MTPQQVIPMESAVPIMPRPTNIRVPEIARRLGVGRLKVYAMLEAGLIPGIHFGRKWIITRFAYENWERTCGVKVPPTGVQ
jgi:excisionase family DNA binding protein